MTSKRNNFILSLVIEPRPLIFVDQMITSLLSIHDFRVTLRTTYLKNNYHISKLKFKKIVSVPPFQIIFAINILTK